MEIIIPNKLHGFQRISLVLLMDPRRVTKSLICHQQHCRTHGKLLERLNILFFCGRWNAISPFAEKDDGWDVITVLSSWFYIKGHLCTITLKIVHAHTHMLSYKFVAFSNKAHSCASLNHSFSAYHQLFFVQLRGCVVALLVGGYESILNA